MMLAPATEVRRMERSMNEALQGGSPPHAHSQRAHCVVMELINVDPHGDDCLETVWSWCTSR